MKTALAVTIALTLLVPTRSRAADRIVFTANQEFLSRVYVLQMNGAVDHYFEYEFYRWCDMEVVDGELYVAEAFAPRVYRVDVETGDLEVIVDDWSLYYFYGLAFDGSYFYVEEWDMNRYTIDGDKDGTAGFDGDVFGCAWDGSNLWTLDDSSFAECWDLTGWPTLVRVPENDIRVPSEACRGLFFDGEYFWTAESLEGTPGKIYRFDYDGTVVRQWTAPAYRGWGACLLRDQTGVDDELAADLLTLSPAQRNPTAGAVRLSLELGAPREVKVSVHDVAGRLVATLIDGKLAPGSQDVVWMPDNVANGVYLIRATDGENEAVAKAVVVR